MRRLLFPALALPITLALLALSSIGFAASKFDLTAAQRERLAKYLPHTYPKLVQHQPVNITLLGDSITGMYVHDDNDNISLKSYGGVFANQLADQFYYVGGVRVDRPYRGTPEKILDIHGPEIMIHNASRGGKLMIHAMNTLDTVVWEDAPDLVIVNFGVNDANSFFSLAEYRKAAQQAIDIIRKHGADVMILGSTLTMTEPPEFGLGLTRAYADIVHELADANGVFTADLGDMTWLVRIDEPMKGLEKPAPKKTEAPAGAAPPPPATTTSTPEGQTPGAMINFPTADELDPDPEKRAARLFKAAIADMRAWYDHGTQMDLIHPNSNLHRLLGRRLFTELLNGPRKTPWTVGAGTAEFKDANTFTLTYRVENLTDAPLRINVLPLIAPNWRPQDAETQLELKPQKKAPLTVTYTRMSPPNGDALPSDSDTLRLPLMMIGAGQAKIETVRSLVQPCTVMWEVASQYNVEDDFTINAKVANTNNDDLVGTWEAEWEGQKQTGKVNVGPHKTTPVTLHFKLPSDNSGLTRQRGVLHFNIAAHGITMPFTHEVEVIPNVGLKQAVPLPAVEDYALDHVKPLLLPSASHPGVTFRFDADPKALYMTWDFIGLNLADDKKGHAVTVEMNIDARSYGKRLTFGVTDAIHFLSGAADDDGDTPPMQAWSFGNGYGAQRLDLSLVKSHMSSRPDGSRRFTVMLPRSFFYLHEWALGNGNSQLGYNMTVIVHQKADDKNPEGFDIPYVFGESTLHRDDANSSSVLELSEHPTRRWTVHFK